MNIYGKNVVLRAIEKRDCELIRELFNSAQIEHSVVGWAFPISEIAQEKWIETNFNSADKRFVIQTAEGEAVGIATLVNIDWKNRRAEHGIKLLKEAQGKGIGQDAVMAVERYAFDELQFERLDGGWLEDNKASKHMYEKCGWQEEGTRKNYVYKNGAYKNLKIAGILKEDYYELISSNGYWNCDTANMRSGGARSKIAANFTSAVYTCMSLSEGRCCA